MLLLCAPAGFEHFVLEMSEPATDSTLPPPDMAKLMTLAAKYKIDIHGPLPEQPEVIDGERKSDREAIESVRDVHVAALNARDAAAWAAVFTEDAVQMPPNAPANVGRANIGSWAAGFLGMFRVQFSLSVTDVQIASDRAIECGGYAITMTPDAGGPTMEDAGKYITIYQRLATGDWAVARDIWNSDHRIGER
jgi:uncharacterized protein (TIGR02246 family)